MALDHNEFLRLSGIAESLRRSDPELARTLALPMRRRSPWTVLRCVALSVLALAALTLGIGDTTTPSSTIANSPLHQDESASTGMRSQLHVQEHGLLAGRQGSMTLFPENYGGPAAP
jgi:hypothetical protein